MPSDSDRLLAEGAPITLAGGRVVRLRYTMRSLKAFEDSFGSVAAAQRLLVGLFTGENPKTIGTLVPILAAGLNHEGLSEDDLFDSPILERNKFGEYLAAVSDALEQSFVKASPGKEQAGETTPSPGTPTTTSPPSASVEATNSSGP